ncbi:MAG: hypothetical protein DRJ65_02155 [Acidobacteria bacterium]|nr:MAG: hypothetical protein DRJ65_02155 [Acidobacteriota bacterium]
MPQPLDWNRLESLLDELLDLPADQRAERIDQLKHELPDVAARLLDALDLEADVPGIDHIGALIEAVGADAENDQCIPAQSWPDTIGPWRLTELIASGGMGDVFRARRADGEYEATAALKRLRMHVTSPTAHDRFRRERQVLADLHHPHIAKLLDGGVDSTGVPYFVMEFVDGRPITTHCNETELTVRERLEVFNQVTDAVAAAHQKLVVHRDLKPPNILVAANGGAKLVDFGIAKLLDDPLATTATETHERILTPRYAAPEQLLGGEITTATDVYGLGVVLYELLSGCRPLEDETLQKSLRAGVGVPDPPRMSTSITRLDRDEAVSIAQKRAVAPRALVRELRGDLDEIVAKALRPDAGERYPTVGAFAADLQRARNSEPVKAHRGSWPYRARKLWTRHRLSLTAASLIGLSLTTGLWIALAQARAARIAERQAAAINRFLTEELLGSADPRIALGREITVRDVVDRTSRSLAATFGEDPAIEASIRKTLGEVWTRLGSFEQAQEQLKAARTLAEPDSMTRAHLSAAFAELFYAEGRYEEARTEAEAAVDQLTAKTGDRSLATLQARVTMARIIDADGDPLMAEEILRETMALLDQNLPGQSAMRAEARLSLAGVLAAQGRRVEGLDNLREALSLQREALGGNHPDVARTLEQIADIQSRHGRFDKAMDAALAAHEINLEVYGPDYWQTVRSSYFLAKTNYQADRLEDAERIASSTLETAVPALGESHPDVVLLHNMLAFIAQQRDQPAAAEAHFRDALAGSELGLGAGHDTTMMVRRNFSEFLASQGRIEGAVRLAHVVREHALEAADNPHPDPMYLAKASFFLSSATLEKARDLEAALALAERAVEASRGRWYYPWVALSEAHFRRGELNEAIAAQRRALSLPDGLHYAGEESYLIRLFTENGDLQAAESFLDEHLRRRQAAGPEDDPLLGHSHALLGRVLLAQGQTVEAIVELREALAIYDLRLPDDHEWRVTVLSDLGAALTNNDAFDNAESLLAQALDLASAATGPRASEDLALIEERLAALAMRRGGVPPGAAVTKPGP